MANHSESWVTFTDYDDNHTPYDGLAVRIRLSADVLFIYIGRLKEELGSETFTYSHELSVGVDAEALYEALRSMLRRSDREAVGLLGDGKIGPADPRLVVAPVGGVAPAIRRRA